MTGPPLHPLLLDPTPRWPELPEEPPTPADLGWLWAWMALACLPWLLLLVWSWL